MPTMMIAIIWSEDLGPLCSLPPEGGFAFDSVEVNFALVPSALRYHMSDYCT